MKRARGTPLERWSSKITRAANGCWEWTGGRTRSGYGMFMWKSGLRVTAHRAGYQLHVGEIPAGWEVHHLCRNRCCVNPDHLEAVTLADNRRMREVARGVQTVNGRKTHCPQGHPYSGSNLSVGQNGARSCKRCNVASTLRSQALRKSMGGEPHFG